MHLHLSLGMLGLAWSQNWDACRCFPLSILILFGIVCKGAIAKPKPESLHFRDRNALWGLYIPNTLALLCVAWALFGIITVPEETDSMSRHVQQVPVLSNSIFGK